MLSGRGACPVAQKAARSVQAGQGHRKNTVAMAGIAELMEILQSESKAGDGQRAHEEMGKPSVRMESLQKSRGIPHQTNPATGAAMSAKQNPALQWELLMPGSSCWQLMLSTAHAG